MTQLDIQRVCSAIRRGAQVSIGRNHFGRAKLKLKSGPFGLFVQRFEVTEEQIVTIKSVLAHPARHRPVKIPMLNI